MDHLRYVDVLSFLNNSAFIHVVEHLEGLVVQRLFELSKANLASTGGFTKFMLSLRATQTTMCAGYKMQKQISNAIARQSAAIRTALSKYNELAPLQQPPRPILEYGDLALYSWLGDFDLLKYSHMDIM